MTSHQHQKNLNLRICFVVEFLEIWTWNLRGYISHVVCQKKACLIAPWRRNEERRGWAVFCHTESKKEVTEKSKGKRSSNQIKRCKGERMNAEAWRSVFSCPVKEKQKLTAPGYSQAVSHPSTNQGPTLLSFRDRTRSGVLRVVWP